MSPVLRFLLVNAIIVLMTISSGRTEMVSEVDTTRIWEEPQQPKKSFGEVLGDVPKVVASTPMYIVEGIAWAGVKTVYSSEFLYNIARTLVSPVPYRGVVPVFGYGSNVGLKAGGKLGYRDVFARRDYLRTIVTYSSHHYQRYGFKYDSPLLYGERGGLLFTADYRHEPYESFYGLGNDAAVGDEVAYTLESTVFRLENTLRIVDDLDGLVGVGYSITNAFDGENDDRLSDLDGIRDRFDLSRAQTDVARLITLSAGLAHDWRDHPGQPSRGGVEKLTVRYHLGVDRTSDLEFSEIELDTWHFVNLYRKRILAFRASVRLLSSPDDAAEIPFYLIDGLGGSDLLRGYRTDRFVAPDYTLASVEYRWPIWDVFDAFLFYDVGRVYGDIEDDFTWKDWHKSCGFGLRVWGDGGTRVRLTTGFSQETTRFYLQVGEEF